MAAQMMVDGVSRFSHLAQIYAFNGDKAWSPLSTFYVHNFSIEGRQWPTVEHFLVGCLIQIQTKQVLIYNRDGRRQRSTDRII